MGDLHALQYGKALQKAAEGIYYLLVLQCAAVLPLLLDVLGQVAEPLLHAQVPESTGPKTPVLAARLHHEITLIGNDGPRLAGQGLEGGYFLQEVLVLVVAVDFRPLDGDVAAVEGAGIDQTVAPADFVFNYEIVDFDVGFEQLLVLEECAADHVAGAGCEICCNFIVKFQIEYNSVIYAYYAAVLYYRNLLQQLT